MSYVWNVLVGIPKTWESQLEHRFEDLIRSCLKDKVCRVTVIRSVSEYRAELLSGKVYEAVILVDNLGMGEEYSQYTYDGPGLNRTNCIVIIPERCFGSVHLESFMERGIYNALYERDLNEISLGNLLRYPRTAEDARSYYGVSTALVKSGYSYEKEEVNEYAVTQSDAKREIVKTKLADGIFVTRLCAMDAQKNSQGEVGDDDVMKSFLGNMENFEEMFKGRQVQKEESKLVNFPLEPEWMEPYKDKLRKYSRGKGLYFFQSYEKGDITEEEFEEVIKGVLKKYELDAEKEQLVYESFMRDVASYGKLDAVIATPEVTDIRLINKDTINVQIKGEWYRSNISFAEEEEYLSFLHHICSKNHAAVNVRQAQNIFTDIETNPLARLRFTVTHSLLNSSGTMTCHIRKVDKVKKSTPQLIKEGLFTAKQAGFLINAIKHGKSIIICGGSGSGKTVVLNNLLEYEADSVCGVCIQEADELHSDTKKNIEFQHSISAKGEGKVEYTLRQLATMALLKNVELFIIGEIKGDEARDFFTASITGAQVLCTTHADSCFEALPRIADLAKYTGDYTQKDLLKMLSRSIDYVVYLENYKMMQIAGVVGWDDDRKDIIYDLYDFNN